MKRLGQLPRLINEVPPRLNKLPPSQAEARPSLSKWSPKEELGHLLDSAANNHQRLGPTQPEDEPKMAGYDGAAWVQLHQYQQRNWQEMIELRRALNHQLLIAA